MKVAIINTVIGTGSVGRIAKGTADEIIKNGGEALLCRGRGGELPGYDNYRVGSDLDMFCHGIMTRITDKHGLYSKNATRGLIRKLEAYDPDVIQLHNIHGYYVNYPELFKWLKTCGKPVVWTLHDCWSFTGHCVHYEYCGCEKWEKAECADCPEKSEYPASYVRDFSKGNIARKKECFTGVPKLQLVTPSEWLKKAAERSILAEYPVQVINTGIDPDTFKPVSTDLRQRYDIGDRILLLGVANPWRERKGLYEFVALHEKLEQEYPGKYRIALVGLKSSQMAELPEGIIKTGHTESVEELAAWYSAADFYVNLTFGDTFPTTNIEALACGTPVITYDAGGSGEMLNDKVGAVVSQGDLDAVIRATEQLKGELPCREQAMRYAGQAKYREYYELYQKI
ncbi:MAG: glycosyltransferase [Lachnospiraceae bacterium]|nr:glycosyltransferase [Lachnospiraceae bacterium]